MINYDYFWNKGIDAIAKIDGIDYDTVRFYWKRILGNSCEFNQSDLSKLPDEPAIVSDKVLFETNSNNIYSMDTDKLVSEVFYFNCKKLCYNEALYLWIIKVIFSHNYLSDCDLRYFYIDYKVIDEILNRDVIIFRNIMRLLRDKYDLCPIRSSSLWILDKYEATDKDTYIIESEIDESDFDRWDDEEFLESKYEGLVHQIDYNEEYISAKRYYMNCLITKIIISNVHNKEI